MSTRPRQLGPLWYLSSQVGDPLFDEPDASVADASVVDGARLMALGARAIARPRPDSIHLIVGPQADALAAAIGAML